VLLSPQLSRKVVFSELCKDALSEFCNCLRTSPNSATTLPLAPTVRRYVCDFSGKLLYLNFVKVLYLNVLHLPENFPPFSTHLLPLLTVAIVSNFSTSCSEICNVPSVLFLILMIIRVHFMTWQIHRDNVDSTRALERLYTVL